MSQATPHQHPAPYVNARAAAKRAHNARWIAPLILLAGLMLSILMVVFVPLLVDGSEPASSRVTRQMEMTAPELETVACNDIDEAVALLGFVPALPGQTPEGYSLKAIEVLDGKILQLTYSGGGRTILYRTAPGNEDLSGDVNEYPYTATEEVDGVARSYAGADEDHLNVAYWILGENSFALSASEGADAQVIKALAESVT